MFLKSYTIGGLYLFCLCLFTAQLCFAKEVANRDELEKYAKKLIEDGYNILHDNELEKEERKQKISRLIENNMNLEWMANYTLGRKRRQLSEAKRKEFVQVYARFVIKVYTDLSNHYNGQKAAIKKVKEIDDDMFIVNMEILRTNSQPPIKIDYLVQNVAQNKPKPAFKVADIITEGISILNSQQSEFKAIIANQGIDGLIKNLEGKINKQNESNKKSSKSRI